jgi:DNA-binding response OmpR family regulator
MKRKGVARFGEIVIDFDRMELRRSGRAIPATFLEFKLLRFFVKNPQYVFSREELIRAVWPERNRATRRTVDNSISHLRQKLEKDPAHPVYFQTVHCAGYKFVPSRAEMSARHGVSPSRHK